MCASRNRANRGGNKIFRRERENSWSSRGRIHASAEREREDEQPTEREDECRVQPRSRRWTFEDVLEATGG